MAQLTNAQLELKVSLCKAIETWWESASDTDGWNDFDMPTGDLTSELMADAAFNILLAQQTQNVYLYNNDMIKED